MHFNMTLHQSFSMLVSNSVYLSGWVRPAAVATMVGPFPMLHRGHILLHRSDMCCKARWISQRKASAFPSKASVRAGYGERRSVPSAVFGHGSSKFAVTGNRSVRRVYRLWSLNIRPFCPVLRRAQGCKVDTPCVSMITGHESVRRSGRYKPKQLSLCLFRLAFLEHNWRGIRRSLCRGRRH